MQKTYRFHAKQGQESLICRILTDKFGKPKARKTEQGVMITLDLPKGVSKRTIDRTLYSEQIPGSVSKRNKIPVVKNYWDVYQHSVCYCTESGKFVKYYRVNPGCDCCGSWYEPVNRRSKRK